MTVTGLGGRPNTYSVYIWIYEHSISPPNIYRAVFLSEIREKVMDMWYMHTKNHMFNIHTFQGINISHLGKRKIIFKMPFLRGYVSFLEGTYMTYANYKYLKKLLGDVLNFRQKTSMRRQGRKGDQGVFKEIEGFLMWKEWIYFFPSWN